MRRIRKITVGTGRTRIAVALYEIGPDLLAVLEGEGAHIGAATLAESDRRTGLRSETVAALGHREFEITREFSQAMCSAIGRRTVAVAGVHLDDIRKDEIEDIRRNVSEAVAILGSAARSFSEAGVDDSHAPPQGSRSPFGPVVADPG